MMSRRCIPRLRVGPRISGGALCTILNRAAQIRQLVQRFDRGIPENIRSDNGSEFVAEELRKWLASKSNL